MVTYTGEFLNDKKEGYGILKKEKPSTKGGSELELIDKIEGHWKDGKLHGLCFQLYDDGSTFEGMYLNGKRNGYGREANITGKEWAEGYWVDNVLNHSSTVDSYATGYQHGLHYEVKAKRS